MTIPFIDLKTQYRALRESILERIERVTEHGQFIMGPEVEELEERLACLVGTRHCVTVASGTEALLIALMALGVGPGDEVITTPFSFIATAEAIVLLGAKPVFVDVEPETCNIDPSLIEARITELTRAIMPVSLYGQPADMDEINLIAARYDLPVIEDAAQSFGAQYKGRWSCALSTIGCTSFFPSKPLGCYGDGGAMFMDDGELAQACREIRVHGQSARYVHTRVGVGGRMDTMQCAVILAKLERFEWELARRRAKGSTYNEAFDQAGLERVVQRPDRTSVFAQYTLMTDDREGVLARLKERGIPTAVHYPVPMNKQPAYRAYDEEMPVAERLAERVFSIPISADIGEEQQGEVIAAVLASQRAMAA